MIVHTDEKDAIVGSGKANEFKFTIDAKTYSLLTHKLYEYPLDSTIREIISNAVDAARSSNLAKKGIIEPEIRISVTAGSTSDLDIVNGVKHDIILTVSDNGRGIPHEDFDDVYNNFFNSSKDKCADSIGGFGLGSKSPFSVSQQFSVTNIHGGISRTYVYTMNRGIPSYVMIKEEKINTFGRAGLIVEIPLCSDKFSFDQVVGLIRRRVAYHFDVRFMIEFINGGETTIGTLFPEEEIKHRNSKIIDDNKSEFNFVVNGVGYTDRAAGGLLSNFLSNNQNLDCVKLIKKMNYNRYVYILDSYINDISFVPSRDTFSFESDHKEAIFNHIAAGFVQMLHSHIMERGFVYKSFRHDFDELFCYMVKRKAEGDSSIDVFMKLANVPLDMLDPYVDQYKKNIAKYPMLDKMIEFSNYDVELLYNDGGYITNSVSSIFPLMHIDVKPMIVDRSRFNKLRSNLFVSTVPLLEDHPYILMWVVSNGRLNNRRIATTFLVDMFGDKREIKFYYDVFDNLNLRFDKVDSGVGNITQSKDLRLDVDKGINTNPTARFFLSYTNSEKLVVKTPKRSKVQSNEPRDPCSVKVYYHESDQDRVGTLQNAYIHVIDGDVMSIDISGSSFEFTSDKIGKDFDIFYIDSAIEFGALLSSRNNRRVIGINSSSMDKFGDMNFGGLTINEHIAKNHIFNYLQLDEIETTIAGLLIVGDSKLSKLIKKYSTDFNRAFYGNKIWMLQCGYWATDILKEILFRDASKGSAIHQIQTSIRRFIRRGHKIINTTGNKIESHRGTSRSLIRYLMDDSDTNALELASDLKDLINRVIAEGR